LLCQRELHSDRRATQERGAQPHRDERERARLHEIAAMHGYLLWNSGEPIASPTINANPRAGGCSLPNARSRAGPLIAGATAGSGSINSASSGSTGSFGFAGAGVVSSAAADARNGF